MKAYEISKNNADIPHGRVLMAIEGEENSLNVLVNALSENGYASTKCSDIGDKEGEIIEYFMIARQNKKDFMLTYKTLKQFKI